MLYLKGRTCLRRVALLIDARRGIGDADREVMTALDAAAVSYQVVLTKGDKETPAALGRLIDDIGGEIAKHPAAHPEVLVTSAYEGAGISELRTVIAGLAAPRQAG